MPFKHPKQNKRPLVEQLDCDESETIVDLTQESEPDYVNDVEYDSLSESSEDEEDPPPRPPVRERGNVEGDVLEPEDPPVQDLRKRSTRVRFVLNNPTEQEVQHLLHQGDLVQSERHTHLTYLVWGHEIAPTTGTPHLQGYAEFKQSTWSTIRDFLGARMAFKSCQASGDANDRYCKKDGQYRCFGTIRPGQGARTDLSDVAAAVLEGKKVAHVANEYPVQFIKYHQGITKLIGLQEPQRRQKPWVLWLWGPPGTGKSKSAFEIAERCNSFYYKDLTTWWDNYEQQECVILDDFRPNTGDRTNNDSTISYQYMLKLLDRYPLMVQRKGGYMNFNSSIIIITAPMTPRDMFAHVTEDILQLTRRIDHVVHFPALIPDATAANLLAPMQDVPAPLAASFNPPRAPLMPLLNHGSNDENVPPESVVEPTSVALAIADWISEDA